MTAAVTVRALNPALWLGAPMLVCAALSVLFALPLRVAGLQLPEPVFALPLAFAWALGRPSLLPPFALLTLGLFLDLLWGTPLGLWPLCLMAAYAPALFGRRTLTGQNFGILWVWYAGACALAFATGFVFTCVREKVMPGLGGVGFQWLASAALFPAAHFLIRTQEEAGVRFR
jgi:rod shape-determining protein MreD